MAKADDVLFGPHSIFSIDLIEETEDLTSTVALGIQAEVLMTTDVTDQILVVFFCREYDPGTESIAVIHGFSVEHPSEHPWILHACYSCAWLACWIALMTARVFTLLKKTSLPCKRALLQGPPPFRGRSRRWPRVSNAMIADQLSTLVAQMQVLNQRQDRLERSKGFSATDVCFAGSRSKLPAACCFSWYPETRCFASGICMPKHEPWRVLHQRSELRCHAGAGPKEPYDAADEPAGIAAALTQQSTAITAALVTSQSVSRRVVRLHSGGESDRYHQRHGTVHTLCNWYNSSIAAFTHLALSLSRRRSSQAFRCSATWQKILERQGF